MVTGLSESNSTINLENSILEESKYPIFFRGTSNVHIILRNVTFQNNSHMPVFEVGTMATANFCEVQDLHLINCSFVRNTATALYVESVTFMFMEN